MTVFSTTQRIVVALKILLVNRPVSIYLLSTGNSEKCKSSKI